MNLIDRKTHFLGNYNHDFPRLAKQSGFFFQLYRGRVNWSEIECLNLDDITKNRNFELLEENLLNVLNFNLERDYDLKILDQNFVKLFKLAQLGIDYLSYCELYLDRCVVLLQEQLMSIQEEFESLKNENVEKNTELKQTKTKREINNFQCEKCEKVFISDVYLKFHNKRRHSNLLSPKSEKSLKKLVDASQQTEIEGKSSVSIQTFLVETDAAPKKIEEMRKIKNGHNKKIKRLEKNLNDLRARLQKTEKVLQETRKANSAPVTFPSSVHYHSLLQLTPSCFPPSRNIPETIPDYQKTYATSRYPMTDLGVDVAPGVTEEQKPPISASGSPKEYKGLNPEKNSQDTKIDVMNNKENMHPQDLINVTKPLPPPRKTKKKFQNILYTEESLAVETFNQLKNSVRFAADIVPFDNQLIDITSVKEKPEPSIDSENFEEIKESSLEGIYGEKANRNESLNITKEKREEHKSFFKKVVGRSSPKLQKLRKNLKRPLTNFCDSVSSTGKDFMKIENKLQSTKNVLIDGLNNQLRGLGIDPEWKGIPKKTMKEKLKDLTHRRKLLPKANPLYASVRQSKEENAFKKLKKNFLIGKPMPERRCDREMEEEIHGTDENGCFERQESKNVGNRNCAILYDTDVDSWSELEETRGQQTFQPQLEKVNGCHSEEEKAGEKNFDICVFEVKKGSVENRQEKCKDEKPKEDEILTNSDFEDDFSVQSDNGFFKTINVHIKDDKKQF